MQEENKYKIMTDLLLNEIKLQFGNLHKFASLSGLNYQTINSMFKRGIKNSSIDSIKKVCAYLEIDIVSLIYELKIVKIKDTEKYKENLFLSKFKMLDAQQKKLLMDYIDLLLMAKSKEDDE
ncbi:MAG: hypothetical protein M0R77_21300 [Gammaproteobacteria bacterium]|nr:hypothetical protein [Gammaproteobacteria bacterium]